MKVWENRTGNFSMEYNLKRYKRCNISNNLRVPTWKWSSKILRIFLIQIPLYNLETIVSWKNTRPTPAHFILFLK